VAALVSAVQAAFVALGSRLECHIMGDHNIRFDAPDQGNQAPSCLGWVGLVEAAGIRILRRTDHTRIAEPEEAHIGEAERLRRRHQLLGTDLCQRLGRRQTGSLISPASPRVTQTSVTFAPAQNWRSEIQLYTSTPSDSQLKGTSGSQEWQTMDRACHRTSGRCGEP
jgi:hypothetical protein